MFDRLSRYWSSRSDPHRLYAACLAVVAGVVVFAVASALFPYHSSNDDEAVYLLQAAMLLEGQVELFAGDLAGAFRPWFFVEDGGRLYPKYTPVPAAMVAVSMALFGEPRVTLAAVAAGNAALTYVLGSRVFDRRVGVLAAALFAASPMALLTSSVFLPYAPTTLLNLCFAVAYLRGRRTGRLRDAGLAGAAIGVAFFARPYTAVLFAAPFVGHAGWTVLEPIRRGEWGPPRDPRPIPDPVRRNFLTAGVGLAFVGLALAYNARLTGDPLVFPYEAFAPLDGPGFGYREIEGYSQAYTPSLALSANGHALWYLATRWIVAGPLGALAALGGLALALWRWRPFRPSAGSPDRGRTAGVLLAGLVVTVPVGNLAFWGNRNVLATMDDPTNGLVSQFGPFYHFDLLPALSIFAAFGAVAAWRRLRSRLRTRDERVRERPGRRRADESATVRRRSALLFAALAASVLVVGAANAAVLSGPVERNAAHTDRFEAAYEPFEARDLENALVFVPTPYGQWQGHPFQALRNDPGLDGEVVYALDGDPGRDVDVLAAYPDREYYRYTYRGEWTAGPDDPVVPTLEALDVREAGSFAGETVVGVPDRVDHATVRLESESEHVDYHVPDPGDRIAVDWTLEGRDANASAVASLAAPEIAGRGDGRANASEAIRTSAADANATVPIGSAEEVVLSVTLVQPDGGTYTYRQEATVRPTADGIVVVWPPERTGCPLVTDCGREGTYLPDSPDVHADWERFETRLEAR